MHLSPLDRVVQEKMTMTMYLVILSLKHQNSFILFLISLLKYILINMNESDLALLIVFLKLSHVAAPVYACPMLYKNARKYCKRSIGIK